MIGVPVVRCCQVLNIPSGVIGYGAVGVAYPLGGAYGMVKGFADTDITGSRTGGAGDVSESDNSSPCSTRKLPAGDPNGLAIAGRGDDGRDRVGW